MATRRTRVRAGLGNARVDPTARGRRPDPEVVRRVCLRDEWWRLERHRNGASARSALGLPVHDEHITRHAQPLSVEVLRAGEHVEPEGESGAQTPAEHRRRLPDSLLESVMHGFMSRLRYPGRRAQIPQPIPTPPACLPLLEDPSESPPLARVRIAAAIAMPTQSHESILPLYALGVAEVGLCGGTTYFS
ncbi:hypothetical protein C8Q78DRAFT_1005536 [Trametes maxima]|nr:hypothetical protein C8Q78DRAFT_1005536 [Trametes maxima]